MEEDLVYGTFKKADQCWMPITWFSGLRDAVEVIQAHDQAKIWVVSNHRECLKKTLAAVEDREGPVF